MQQHLLLHPQPGQFRQHPLGLAEGVAEQQRRPIRGAAPPAHDLGRHRRTALPAVDRQAECGLADQHIGLHGLKGRAAGVGAPLVVAAHQPALAARLDPDLGRPQHMAGGMERHARVADAVQLAVLHRQQADAAAQPLPQDPFTAADRPVLAAAGPGMVGMGVGDQGPRHWPPGIDPGLGGPAEQALGGEGQQGIWREHPRRWGAAIVASATGGR